MNSLEVTGVAGAGAGNAPSAGDGTSSTTEVSASHVAAGSAAAEASSAARPEIRELLGAYQEALAIAGELPLFVPVRATQRRRHWLRRVFVLPRPRWLLRTILLHHVIGVLDALDRRYHLRAALDTTDCYDATDQKVVDHFRRSLPALHSARLAALLLISVLVVGQLTLASLSIAADGGGVEASPATGSNERGVLIDRTQEEAGSSRADTQHREQEPTGQPSPLETLSELMNYTLSAAMLDLGSSGRLLQSLLDADPVTFAMLVGFLALITYTVLRPFVPVFRLKRLVFNLHPDVRGYLRRTAAPWHVTHSTGTYNLEAATFQALGQQSPPTEKPLDLGVLAIPPALFTVVSAVVGLVAGRWAAELFVGAQSFVWGIGIALGLTALLGSPFIARLYWLLDALRQRRLFVPASGLSGEITLPGTQTVILIRRPDHIALFSALLYATVAASVIHTLILEAQSVDLYYTWLDWLEGGLYWAVVVAILCVPWLYRVTLELRELERARGWRLGLGRRPRVVLAVTLIGFLVLFVGPLQGQAFLLAVTPLGLLYLLIVTAIVIRRAQELAGTPRLPLRLWMFFLGLFAPPLLLCYLQAQLNLVWREVGSPIAEQAPTSMDEPSPLAPISTERGPYRRRVLVGLGLAVLGIGAIAAVTVEPGPDRFGEDEELDELWSQCDNGEWDSCYYLQYESPPNSAYRGFADRNLPVRYGDAPDLDALWDTCADGAGDACAELYRTAWWDSEYLDFAEVNRPRRYGDSPLLDALQDACVAGDGDACLELDGALWWDSEYRDIAQANLPERYGDAPSLDDVVDSCVAGDGDACLELDRMGYWDSEYGDIAEENRPERYGDAPSLDAVVDACVSGEVGGYTPGMFVYGVDDACLELYWMVHWDSEYREIAKANLRPSWWRRLIGATASRAGS
jgi:hypothetical protein